jgi:hypothetical protein
MNSKDSDLWQLVPDYYRTQDNKLAAGRNDRLTHHQRDRLQALTGISDGGQALAPADRAELRWLQDLVDGSVGPLQGLLRLLSEQLALFDESLDQLYDDLFVETCAPWVLPYIAELVGASTRENGLISRREAANSIRLRRRKGTASALQDLAEALAPTEASVIVTEYFRHLAMTQYSNHLRLDRTNVDVRSLARGDSSPDRLNRTVDVRGVGRGGRYNVRNIVAHVWLDGERRFTDCPAFRLDPRRLTFDPLGHDTQLIRVLSSDGLPGSLPNTPISRKDLSKSSGQIYGPGRSFSIEIDGRVVGADELESCDLSDRGAIGAALTWSHMDRAKIAVDPELGRILLPADDQSTVRVTYRKAALGHIGGGEFDRSLWMTERSSPVVRVPTDAPTVEQALVLLDGVGCVEVVDNGRYELPVTIRAQENARLQIRAALYVRPVLEAPANGVKVVGSVGAEIEIDGFLVSGSIVVPAQVAGGTELQLLRLTQCSFEAKTGVPSVRIELSGATLEISRCILGAVALDRGVAASIVDSIIDARSEELAAVVALASDGPGAELSVVRSTIFGTVSAWRMEATDTVFCALRSGGPPISIVRKQSGNVSHCVLPEGSNTPRRVKCVEASSLTRTWPMFCSLDQHLPGYMVLHPGAPDAICLGASNGGEMGAFNDVSARLVERRLLRDLVDFVPAEMNLGVAMEGYGNHAR